MKKLLVAIMALSIVLPGTAAAAASNKQKILKVEVSETMFAIYAADGGFGKQECESGNVIVFKTEDFPNSHANMLSIALTAHTTGKEVTMWFNGCQTTNWGYTVPKAGTIVIY